MFQINSFECSECEEKSAAHLCDDCTLILCSDCWDEIHSTGKLAVHKKIPVLKSGLYSGESKNVCPIHEKDIKLYCKTCQCGCCVKCQRSPQHATHTESLMCVSDWNKEKISELNGKREGLSSLALILTKTINSDKPESTAIGPFVSQLEDDIRAAFVRIRASVDAREAVLLEQARRSFDSMSVESDEKKEHFAGATDWLLAFVEDLDALQDCDQEVDTPLKFAEVEEKVNELVQLVADLNNSPNGCAPQSGVPKVVTSSPDQLNSMMERMVTLKRSREAEVTTNGRQEVLHSAGPAATGDDTDSDDQEYTAHGVPAEDSTPSAPKAKQRPSVPRYEAPVLRNLMDVSASVSGSGEAATSPTHVEVYRTNDVTYAGAKNFRNQRRPAKKTFGSLPDSRLTGSGYQRGRPSYQPHPPGHFRFLDNEDYAVGRFMKWLFKGSFNEKATLVSRDRVNISYCVTPSDFYVRKTTNDDKMNALCEYLENLASERLLVTIGVTSLRRGEILIGQCKDGRWYRLRVINDLTKEECRKAMYGELIPVFQVDRGEVVALPTQQLFRVSAFEGPYGPMDFSVAPPMAHWCQLADVTPKKREWDAAATQAFAEETFNMELIVMLHPKSRLPRVTVELIRVCDRVSIKEKLIFQNLGVVYSNKTGPKNNGDGLKLPSPTKQITTLPPVAQAYPAREPLPSMCTIHVTAFDPPDRFCVQRADLTRHQETLERIHHRLQQVYSQARFEYNYPATAKLEEGWACVAQFTQDCYWYRARVVKVLSRDEYNVEFVDFGNTEARSKTDLKRILSEFIEEAPLATVCTLEGVSIPQTDSTHMIMQELEQMLLDQRFQLTYNPMDQAEDQVVKVTLTAPHSSESINERFRSELQQRLLQSPSDSKRARTNVAMANAMNQSRVLQLPSSQGPSVSTTPKSSTPISELTKETTNEEAIPVISHPVALRPVNKRGIHTATSNKPRVNTEEEDQREHLIGDISPDLVAQLPTYLVADWISPHDFYLRPREQPECMEALGKISEALESFYQFLKNKRRSLSVWIPGTFCVVQHSRDLKFYRARLLDSDQDLADKVKVRLVDYGENVVLPRDQCFYLPGHLAALSPALAVRCCLWGVRPAGGGDRWPIVTRDVVEGFLRRAEDGRVRVVAAGVDKVAMGGLASSVAQSKLTLAGAGERIWAKSGAVPVDLILECKDPDGVPVYKNFGAWLADKGVALRDRSSLKILESGHRPAGDTVLPSVPEDASVDQDSETVSSREGMDNLQDEDSSDVTSGHVSPRKNPEKIDLEDSSDVDTVNTSQLDSSAVDVEEKEEMVVVCNEEQKIVVEETEVVLEDKNCNEDAFVVEEKEDGVDSVACNDVREVVEDEEKTAGNDETEIVVEKEDGVDRVVSNEETQSVEEKDDMEETALQNEGSDVVEEKEVGMDTAVCTEETHSIEGKVDMVLGNEEREVLEEKGDGIDMDVSKEETEEENVDMAMGDVNGEGVEEKADGMDNEATESDEEKDVVKEETVACDMVAENVRVSPLAVFRVNLLEIKRMEVVKNVADVSMEDDEMKENTSNTEKTSNDLENDVGEVLEEEPVAPIELSVVTVPKEAIDDGEVSSDSDDVTVTLYRTVPFISNLPSTGYSLNESERKPSTSSVNPTISRLHWPLFQVPSPDEWDRLPVFVKGLDQDLVLYCHRVDLDPDLPERISAILVSLYGGLDGKSGCADVHIEVPPLTDWSVGDSCVVYIADLACWYRGMVLQIGEKLDSAHVLLVDLGRVYEVVSGLMRPVVDFPNHLYLPEGQDPLTLPPCTLRCRLDHLYPLDPDNEDNMDNTIWQANTRPYVQNIVSNNELCQLGIVRVLQCYYRGEPTATLAVRLMVPGRLGDIELGDALCRKALAYRYDRDNQDEAYHKTEWKFPNYPSLPMPPVGAVVPVYITAAEQPSEVYIQFNTNPEYVSTHSASSLSESSFLRAARDAYNFLVNVAPKEMQTVARTQARFSTDSLNNGDDDEHGFLVKSEACVAQFPDDNDWYRGEIMGRVLGGTAARVHFVDYGNITDVQLDCIVEPLYLEQAACCRKVRWMGVRRHPECTLSPTDLKDAVVLRSSSETYYLRMVKDYDDGRLPDVELFMDEECSKPLLELFAEDELLEAVSPSI